MNLLTLSYIFSGSNPRCVCRVAQKTLIPAELRGRLRVSGVSVPGEAIFGTGVVGYSSQEV